MFERKRFVTYLFQYENYKKCSNCGFARVEQMQHSMQIDLQIQNYPDGTYPFSIIWRTADTLSSAVIDSLTVKNHLGNGRFLISDTTLYSQSHFPLQTEFSIQQTCAIFIQNTPGSFIASQWDDGPLDWKDFYQKHLSPHNISTENFFEASPSQDTSSEPSAGQNTPSETPANQNTLSETPANQNMSSELSAFSAPESSMLWPEEWDTFCQMETPVFPFDWNPKLPVFPFDLKDFSRLPSCYQFLAANRFLLHGYLSYHHLYIFFLPQQTSGAVYSNWDLYLAIPGIFHPQEQRLAELFGFPKFHSFHSKIPIPGSPGCWCRIL